MLCPEISSVISDIKTPDFYLSAASSQLERFSRLPRWPDRPRSAVLDTSRIILRLSSELVTDNLQHSAHLDLSPHPSSCPVTGPSGGDLSLLSLKWKIIQNNQNKF